QFVPLNSARRIDVLRTYLGALPDEGAPPDAFVLRQNLEPLLGALVAPVEVVALRERDRGRPDERRIQAIDATRRVAQHAVDAHAVLLVFVHLLRRLPVLSLGLRLLFRANQPRLDLDQLLHEIPDVHDQIADYREVAQRLDAHRTAAVLRKERGAGQLRLTIHRHAAAPAD